MLDSTHRKNYLRMEIVERNGDDFILEARVWVDHFTARAGCNVTLDELEEWGASLQGLYESLRGDATLSQPGVHVEISGDGSGHITVKGQADSHSGWGHGERAVLQFTLPPLDQTYLPPVIAALAERSGGCLDDG
jgi:hypothetical protein